MFISICVQQESRQNLGQTEAIERTMLTRSVFVIAPSKSPKVPPEICGECVIEVSFRVLMALALQQENRQNSRQPEAMEPLMLDAGNHPLGDVAIEVIRQSAALGSALHPITRQTVAELLRQMNSYYSNLIEGNHTTPIDIERALKAEYTQDPAKRALQLEHLAHMTVQHEMEARLLAEPDLNICEPAFLHWIHSRFFEQLPLELRVVQREGDDKVHAVAGGQLRSIAVQVGKHIPPEPEVLEAFLERFSKAYSPKRLNKLSRVIAAAVSHHRLTWIHPYLDGNGRVARLFSHAYVQRAQIDASGLWSVSRGFARQRTEYVNALATADAPDETNSHLAMSGLEKFCEFFLNTALDQIQFMSGLLELDSLQARLMAYAQRQVLLKQLKPGAGLLLRDALLRGEIERGEAARITGMSVSGAREIVRQLLEEGLLLANSPKGPLRLGLPVKAVGHYFPRLYPEGIVP